MADFAAGASTARSRARGDRGWRQAVWPVSRPRRTRGARSRSRSSPRSTSLRRARGGGPGIHPDRAVHAPPHGRARRRSGSDPRRSPRPRSADRKARSARQNPRRFPVREPGGESEAGPGRSQGAPSRGGGRWPSANSGAVRPEDATIQRPERSPATTVPTVQVDGFIGFDPSRVVETATRAEAIGYDGLWSAETSHDPFLPLALAAEHTERLQL